MESDDGVVVSPVLVVSAVLVVAPLLVQAPRLVSAARTAAAAAAVRRVMMTSSDERALYTRGPSALPGSRQSELLVDEFGAASSGTTASDGASSATSHAPVET